MKKMRKMKPSGVEWIGDIPQEWEINNAFQIFGQVKNKNIGLRETNLLSLSYGKIKRKSISTVGGLLPENFDGYNIIEANDIVLRLTDLQNDHTSLRVGLATERGIVTSAYLTLRNKSSNFAEYLYYYLHSFDLVKGFYGMGSGVRQGLNWDDLKGLIIILPPLSEQQHIAEFLDRKCAEIDSVISKTKATIEQYKALKQSVITQTVTKGIRPDRPMKDSGIEWIGEIPQEWEVKSAFQIFKQVKNLNTNLVETNLLSLSYGKIKRKNIDTLGGLLPENFEGYNIITANDIVLRLTDLQNDHTSLRVGLATETGIVTSAYLSLRNISENLPVYLYYFLHSFDVCKGFYGMGVGIRQGLNWNGIKMLKIVIPSLSEQQEIADYLDEKCDVIDELIRKKEQLLTELESYKKSVIYEYVTGKKEIAHVENNSNIVVFQPSFPAQIISEMSKREIQSVLMAKILDMCSTNIGRIKLMKIMYTTEHHLGFDFDTNYIRQAAGPYDKVIEECENIISEVKHWYTVSKEYHRVSYVPADSKNDYLFYYNKLFQSYDAEICKIICFFKDLKRRHAEIVATLYAAWNDFIIEGKSVSDEQLINEVINNWHERKKRFKRETWELWLRKMKEAGLIPNGYGKHTLKMEVD